MPEETKTQVSRRAVLGLTTAAVAGTLVACDHSHPAISTAPLRRRFVGKSVLITGGTSGIGRAAAEQFAAEGGTVAFCGRRVNLGHEVENGIRSRGGEATYIHADVRDENQVKAFVDKTVHTYGRLDWTASSARSPGARRVAFRR